MTKEQSTTQTTARMPPQNRIASSHYALLGLHPSASPIEIRRVYRKLSKRYHPDTTELPQAIATDKFQQLNEAYAILSNPERRALYDLKIGYSSINVMQAPQNLEQAVSSSELKFPSSAHLDPTDRPLSAGEIFVLFVLAITFLCCLALVIIIGITRRDSQLQEQLSFVFAQLSPQIGWSLNLLLS